MGWWRPVHAQMSSNTLNYIYERYGFILGFSALHDYKRHASRPHLLYSLISFLSLLALVASFVMTGVNSFGRIDIFVENFHMVILLSICLIMVAVSKNTTYAFFKFHCYGSQGFFKYEENIQGSLDIIEQARKKKKLGKTVFSYLLTIIYCLLVAVTPIMNGISSPVKRENDTVNVYLPLAMWTPFDSSSSYTFFAVYIFQSASLIYAASILQLGIIMFITMAEDICTQMSILELSLKKLEDRAAMYSQENSEFANYSYAYLFCLKENIRHHVIILMCWEFFTKLVSAVLFVLFVTGGIILAADVFVLSQEDTKVIVVIRTIAYVICETLVILCICWYGERFQDLESRVRQELYNREWYTWTNEMRSSATIMFEILNRPRTLKAGGIFSATFETFSSILNAAYSYYLVMTILLK